MTKYYGKEGGLGRFEDRIKPMLEASKKLKQKYSEYGEIKVRGNGMAEFVLKKIPSTLNANNDDNAIETKKTLKKKKKKNATIKTTNNNKTKKVKK